MTDNNLQSTANMQGDNARIPKNSTHMAHGRLQGSGPRVCTPTPRVGANTPQAVGQKSRQPVGTRTDGAPNCFVHSLDGSIGARASEELCNVENQHNAWILVST